MRDHSTPTPAKMPVILVLHQPQSIPGFVGKWLEAEGYPLDIRRPRFGDPLPATLEHHAGAVIFGGPMSANDGEDYMRIETDWIGVALAEKKPYLGLCLGAQMMARLLGAQVTLDPAARVEIGYHPIQTATAMPDSFADKLVGAGTPWPSRVYQWHKEGFALPRSATLLAASDGAFPNQAFQVGPKAVGLQFHPEITQGMVDGWTSRNPDKLTQNGAFDRARQLADHVTFSPQVRTWFDGFMRDLLADVFVADAFVAEMGQPVPHRQKEMSQ
jgi:GMP synthase (glutamine-hydrolysing)